jgi:hypothetical protein
VKGARRLLTEPQTNQRLGPRSQSQWPTA